MPTLPDGAPLTLDEYREWRKNATRNLTDNPITKRVTNRPAGTHNAPSILERNNIPVAGERTANQAAFLRGVKWCATELALVSEVDADDLVNRARAAIDMKAAR